MAAPRRAGSLKRGCTGRTRTIIEEHRARGREAQTLSCLSTESPTYATALDASPPPSAATKKNSAAYARRNKENRDYPPDAQTSPRLAG